MFGLGLGRLGATGTRSLDAQIAALFSDGVIFDPSDFGSLFQDAAGTTPVTALEQPVGLMRDKSGNNRHAFHTPGDTTTRPTVSRRINLLTKTEQFDDAVWAKVGTASATSSTSLSFPAVNDYAYQGVSASSVAGRSMTVSMKLSGSGTIALGFYDNVSAFQTTTITLTATPTTYATTKTIGAGAVDVRILVGRIGAVTATSVTTTQASLVPADLAALPYQRVNTTTDYDASSVYPTFLRCDGVNDSLQTNAIDFTGTDKMFVGAAVRKLSDATTGAVVESFDSTTPSGRTFGIRAPFGAAANLSFELTQDGANYAVGAASPFAAPRSMVASGLFDWAQSTNATRVLGRVDGAQQTLSFASSAGTLTSGNFASRKLYLFARSGTSLPFLGWFFGSLIKGATLSASQIALAERWLASKTKTVTV